MKKALVAFALLGSLTAIADLTSSTVTLSSTAEVVDLTFHPSPLPDGGAPVVARVCGHAKRIIDGVDAGYPTLIDCFDTTLAQTNNIAISINQLVARDGGGAALNFWKGQMGGL